VDGRSAWVDATAGLVIPAGATHGFESRGGARVWVVDAPACLSLDRLRAFALPPGWAANPGCDSSPGQGTATDAGTGTGTASSTYGQTGTSLSAAQVLDTLDQAARVQVRRPVEVARLQAAVADTLHQPWPVQRMAALYCLSVPRFQVRWQALTGLSPQAWLRGQRLDAAQRQLKAGWPLETVALQVGYRSASALLFALRRDRGQTTRNLRGG
jgi:AraC-like DNA-binding protein